MGIFRIIVTVAALSFPAISSAQSLEALSSKSKFVNVHFDYLKKENARSIYGSTNPICPSLYWFTRSATAESDAKFNWERDIVGNMSRAGFSESVIAKCKETGSFIISQLMPTNHPKNKKYNGFFTSAVMIWQAKGENSISMIPVFSQTNDYTGSQTFRVYDGNFKELCKINSANLNFKGSCAGLGVAEGRAVKQGDRYTVRWENEKYKVAIFENRTVRFAQQNF